MKLKNIFLALKNNPKKTIFFGLLAGVGIKYGKSKYEEECLMREYCQEALRYGEALQHYDDKERHITVLLNPAANNNKSKARYEKYCAPLLHLAGLKVALVRTEHEGQAKELMNIMDNTDAVIVAGGDGTLQEIITGLLRREDADVASQKFPLGILPLGTLNNCASSIMGFSGQPEAQHMAEAAMAVLKGITQKLNVIEITPVQTDPESESKPVYAASHIEWSPYRDAHERKDTYWYWAILKKYMTYVFSSYKDLNWNLKCSLEYSNPCSGCQKCKAREEEKRLEAEELKLKNRRWWHSFLPRKPVDEVATIDYSNILNEDCGTFHRVEFDDLSEMQISTNNTNYTKDVPGYALSVDLGPKVLGTTDFISEGWSRENGNDPKFESRLITGEILLEPKEEVMKNKAGEERELNIDNSTFEVKPMRIRPIPNAVTIFSVNNFAAT